LNTPAVLAKTPTGAVWNVSVLTVPAAVRKAALLV